jgi:hypothetical protein
MYGSSSGTPLMVTTPLRTTVSPGTAMTRLIYGRSEEEGGQRTTMKAPRRVEEIGPIVERRRLGQDAVDQVGINTEIDRSIHQQVLAVLERWGHAQAINLEVEDHGAHRQEDHQGQEHCFDDLTHDRAASLQCARRRHHRLFDAHPTRRPPLAHGLSLHWPLIVATPAHPSYESAGHAGSFSPATAPSALIAEPGAGDQDTIRLGRSLAADAQPLWHTTTRASRPNGRDVLAFHAEPQGLNALVAPRSPW